MQLHVAFANEIPVAGLLVLLLNSRAAYAASIIRRALSMRAKSGGVVVFASLIDFAGRRGLSLA